MGRSCLVCKKSKDCSLHRFPGDDLRRRKWIDILGFTEDDLLKVKQAYICSDHFEEKNIFRNSSGRIHLKPDSLPYRSDIVSPLRCVLEEDNTSRVSNITLTSGITSSPLDIEEKPPKKRKLDEPRFVGDCNESDMAIPKKAKRYWAVTQETVMKQRRLIRTLRRQNTRLRNKINSFKTLLAHFREKQLISSAAETVIGVI